jgi:hypothetical protein
MGDGLLGGGVIAKSRLTSTAAPFPSADNGVSAFLNAVEENPAVAMGADKAKAYFAILIRQVEFSIGRRASAQQLPTVFQIRHR